MQLVRLPTTPHVSLVHVRRVAWLSRLGSHSSQQKRIYGTANSDPDLPARIGMRSTLLQHPSMVNLITDIREDLLHVRGYVIHGIARVAAATVRGHIPTARPAIPEMRWQLSVNVRT
jgi:hypothetical protein